MLFQQDPSSPKVMVDVGGYRAQARDALIKKTMDAAEKVRRWGEVVEMEPLNAFDRRIVHNALKNDPDLETHSVEVEGTEKKSHFAEAEALKDGLNKSIASQGGFMASFRRRLPIRKPLYRWKCLRGWGRLPKCRS